MQQIEETQKGTPVVSPAEVFKGGDASRRQSEAAKAWKRFRANKIALVGLGVLILLALIAIFANVLAPHDPLKIFPGKRGVGSEAGFWLGYDATGRDILSRLIHGSRVALIVGFTATFMVVTIGVLVGAIAGFFGGWTDQVLSRIIDTLMAFPIIALLILLASVVGASLQTTIIVIGLTGWARYARVVRADVMSVREWDYISAARAVGAKNGRIILRHIIPNILGPVIVLASLGIGGIIILESTLSFLGLGIRPPEPSWGGMLSEGRAFIQNYPQITIAPGIMIMVTVLAFNFVGNGLRDALDPRSKE